MPEAVGYAARPRRPALRPRWRHRPRNRANHQGFFRTRLVSFKIVCAPLGSSFLVEKLFPP